MITAIMKTNLDGPTPLKAAYGDWTKSWEAMFPGVPVVGQKYIKMYHGDQKCTLHICQVTWEEFVVRFGVANMRMIVEVNV